MNLQTKTYSYDAIGNTTADGMQGVTDGVWNVYGKLQSLTNKNAQSVTYTYSADGQRISKVTGNKEEWYVRDATGNIMATYKKDASVNGGDLTVTELYKYGSSLLSVRDTKINVEHPVDGIITFERGDDSYILADGNGNTKVTVSDKKLQHSSNGTTVDYYLADVKTATLHSSFGANAKTYNSGFAQANFNGQRKSLEIGEHSQTAQFWEYNGDVGRRWNVDTKPNTSISSYAAFANNPILYNDLFGDTIILRNDGRVFSNDNIGNGVYIHHFNDNSNRYIGEIGGKIDANEIYSNLLSKNIEEAKGIYNPWTFKAKVTDGGDWDLKVQKSTIWGLGNDGKTSFTFKGKSMESQDIGNHHFGAVAKAALGYLLSEKEILIQAGDNQIANKRSKPEWQPTIKVTRVQYIEHGMHQKVTEIERLPPYGDDPRDAKWIQAGFEYYKQNK